MIAYTTLPAATIDVTRRTTFDIGIGTGDKVTFHAIVVIDRTRRTGRIEVLLDQTSQQFDIGRSTHIATEGDIRIAQTAAISIVTNLSTCLDSYVRIIALPLGIRFHQRVIGKVRIILSHAVPQCFSRFGMSGVIGLSIFHDRLLIEYAAVLTTAIDLPYSGTIFQVNLRIFRPGILTEASTENRCQFTVGLIRPYWGCDVHRTVDGATETVITTIDSRYRGILTMVVHNGLYDIAGVCVIMHTIRTTEDLIQFDGRSVRYVDHRPARDTFLITATIDRIDLSTCQIDDGRGLIGRLCIAGYVCFNTHAQPYKGT